MITGLEKRQKERIDMEFTEDAKIEREKNLSEVIKYDDKERTDFEKELWSTYYESAETVANVSKGGK